MSLPDVRMRGFASRQTVEQALAWIDNQTAVLPEEMVSLWDAAGRVLATAIVSPVNVPSFTRSMMDGFALHAVDTQGAGPYSPLELAIIGQSLPGQPYCEQVQRGQAVRIMTGAPVPTGADAVLPAESVEIRGERLVVLEDVPPLKNIAQPGEDIAVGATILTASRVLRPQDLGLLSSVGFGDVSVVRRPKVRIVITGNELLAPGSPPQPHKIADANGPMLSALVARDGGMPSLGASGSDYLVNDDSASILAAMQDDADVVLVSGGSSVGQEDHAPMLLAEHGELAIHGIAMRPSSPAGMGRLQSRLVFLLPGNPVSCLCAYEFFAGRAIRALGDRSKAWPYRSKKLRLARKLVSVVGRLDYARVRIANDAVEPLATSGASILSSTTRADGFVIVPADSEGYPPEAEVEVFLYDA